MDSDDERPQEGKSREWIRQRSQLGLYKTLIKELIIEDRLSFKELFRMSVEDFEAVLSQIHDLIAPQEFRGGPRPISSDERLELAIRYMATGESLHFLSFQYRISRKAVSYIVKGCCDAIVERMVPIYIPLPSSPDEWRKIAEKFEADVGCNGRNNDGEVWNKSELQKCIEDGTIKLPMNDALSASYPNMPYVFLGDDAFALKTFMMKPYPQNNLTVDK